MVDVELETYCQLLPVDKSHPPIALSDGVAMVMGRGPLTLLTDKKLSRNQVEVTADFSKQELLVKQLGANSSTAAGTLLKKGDTHLLGPMASLELLEGQYKYHVHFSKRVPEELLAKLESAQEDEEEEVRTKIEHKLSPSPTDGDMDTRNNPEPPLNVSRKRRHTPNGSSAGPGEEIKHSPVKKPKTDDLSSNSTDTTPQSTSESPTKEVAKRQTATRSSTRQKSKQASLDSFFAGQSEDKKSDKMVCHWKEVETMMIMKCGDTPPSEKLACFDLDHTLIAPASGRKFATGPSDWKFLPKVVPKLQSLHIDGFKIVVFTNQQGITTGKTTKAEFRTKMEAIADKLQLPFNVVAALDKDRYRKPCLGGWEYFVECENGGVEMDKGSSVYVGDAAGREANWRRGAKKDFSCGDRKFAANLELPFSTPEEFFEDLPKCTKFSMGEFIPSSLNYTKTTHTLTPPTAKIHSDSQEVVIFVGCPASGKSTFYTDHLARKGYAHINRDKLGSWQKCVEECKKQLTAGRSIAIDNTSPDVESRKRYIDCAQKFGVPVRCFQFMTTVAHAKHNNRFREITQRGGKHAKVNDLAFNMYKSKFCEPALSEGFAEIVKVEITPTFRDKKNEQLYKLFLVD